MKYYTIRLMIFIGILFCNTSFADPSSDETQQLDKPKRDNVKYTTFTDIALHPKSWWQSPAKEKDLSWLKGDVNIWSALFSTAILAGSANVISNSPAKHGLETFGQPLDDASQLGDDLYLMIPAAGYSASLMAKDYRGFMLMGLHNSVSSAVMQSLKDGVQQWRPGNQSDTSYPSGHTNTAFLGAAFLQQRYGSRWGAPAYIAAGVVGYTRIHGNWHYANDVISGASISMLSSWALVPPYDRKRRAQWQDLTRKRPYRFEWEMNLNRIANNSLQSNNGGTVFQAPLDKGLHEPWASSHIALEYQFSKQQSVYASFAPWEIRSFGQFSQPVIYNGKTFPANQQIRSQHLLWNYSLQYRHAFINNKQLKFRIGTGLNYLDLEYEMFVVDNNLVEGRALSSTMRTSAWYSSLHADVATKLFSKLWLDGEIDHGKSGSNEFSTWRAGLKWRFNAKWDTFLGWRNFESQFVKNSLRNDFSRRGFALNIGYSY